MVVVGNPANTNAYIAKMYAEGIPAENFTCLTRLDQNRAQAQVIFLQSFPDCRIRAKIYGNCSVLHCVQYNTIKAFITHAWSAGGPNVWCQAIVVYSCMHICTLSTSL